MGKEISCTKKVQDRTQQCLLHVYGLPPQVQRCIYTTNWIERLNRKYRRTIQMRTSMPSEKSVIFLLAAVAMEETKTTYERRIYQFKNWKEKNKITVEVQRKER
ncbi:transposase [Prevotella corporis]|uniref:transposase n=1 Tax=Prevotella corporis TaxID=28128 RepID=UPI002367118E|nr:transposase [Prevotella corporis]